MLFNSIQYLVFLPTVFILYWFVFKSRNGRNAFITVASYVFYGWWNTHFLALIFGLSLANWLAGLGVAKKNFSKRRRRCILWSGIAVNLGVLFLFKYFDFFAFSFTRVLNAMGFVADGITLNLILPVGLSFYVFQAMSYIIDVYRGKIRAERDPLVFFAFISFFAQLVAGPIERASNMLPQFRHAWRRFSYRRGVDGMKLILWGLFKKMAVADNCAIAVNDIFDNYTTAGTGALWLGAFLFSIQIYCDFSGYSDIAVGTGRLFGIDLMRNFRNPYFARNIREFWQRWHISLTNWFRDYVYFPLGGSRKGKLNTIRNSSAVFLLSGLWHGASLTFVLWGAFHALVFMPHIVRGKQKTKTSAASIIPPFGESLAMGLTFLTVMVGWVFFRSVSVSSALDYLRLMFSHFTPLSTAIDPLPPILSLFVLATEWFTRNRETPLQFSHRGIWRIRSVRWATCIALFLFTIIFAGDARSFIYFRF